MNDERVYVRIFNPETAGIDTTVLKVDKFTVQAVFAAMEERKWHFQPGTYVAFRVERDDSLRIGAYWNAVLTFTVEESERVVRERIAVPA